MTNTRRPTNLKRAARELMNQNPNLTYVQARKMALAATADLTSTSQPETECARCRHTAPHDAGGIGVCRAADCGCDGPVNGQTGSFAPHPASGSFGSTVIWTTVSVSPIHITHNEWVRVTEDPPNSWVFRALLDPDTSGYVNSVMIRANEDNLVAEMEEPTIVSEQYPSLLKVLLWAAENGADWVYLDADADVIPDLPRYDDLNAATVQKCPSCDEPLKWDSENEWWVSEDGWATCTVPHSLYENAPSDLHPVPRPV